MNNLNSYHHFSFARIGLLSLFAVCGLFILPSCEKQKENTELTIDGVFSVGENKTVHFTKGNLQYNKKSKTYHIAEHQWDICGDNNKYVLDGEYDGYIDLFAWGTGDNPTQTSIDIYDYQTFTDWGEQKIDNLDASLKPRTLTAEEWKYLFEERKNADKLFAMATVNDIYGMILLPDNWSFDNGYIFVCTTDEGLEHYINKDNGMTFYYDNRNAKVYNVFHYDDNKLTASEWLQYEKLGAIFLPAAGYRYEQIAYSYNSVMFYWQSTAVSAAEGGSLSAFANYLYPSIGNQKAYGYAVRLVY